MKRRLGLAFAILMMCISMLQVTARAAEITVTLGQCYISGSDVNLVAAGPVAQSDTGLYYLFELKPYEAGIGSRKDYCTYATAAEAVTFKTPLEFNTVNSKLYSRFVIAVVRNGKYVQISNDMYITNPEAVATKAIGYPARSKKGIIADWRYPQDLVDMNAGYATYVLNVNQFFEQGGIGYTYNGKYYEFSAWSVAAYDKICTDFTNAGCNVMMVISNSYNKSTLDMIPPAARVKGKFNYAFNVKEQIPTEKLIALMTFLAERYSNNGYGAIHSWIIGNEVNNNSPAHYAGNMNVNQFAYDYATQFRVMYNAIKSVNKDARIFTNVDQRWNFVDGTANQYAGRTFLDTFAAYINASGNIDWGLSFHPHPLPLTNAAFWNVPKAYARMNLVSYEDDSKFVTTQNMQVIPNHMTLPNMLNPEGKVRHLVITELGFPSSSREYATNEQLQAAALAYAYKIAESIPSIEAFVIHKHTDDAGEAREGLAYGLRTDTTYKLSYQVFKNMDTNPAFLDFALPIIGISKWSQLGLKDAN